VQRSAIPAVYRLNLELSRALHRRSELQDRRRGDRWRARLGFRKDGTRFSCRLPEFRPIYPKHSNLIVQRLLSSNCPAAVSITIPSLVVAYCANRLFATALLSELEGQSGQRIPGEWCRQRPVTVSISRSCGWSGQVKIIMVHRFGVQRKAFRNLPGASQGKLT
jgi:hypothetical protein